MDGSHHIPGAYLGVVSIYPFEQGPSSLYIQLSWVAMKSMIHLSRLPDPSPKAYVPGVRSLLAGAGAPGSVPVRIVEKLQNCHCCSVELLTAASLGGSFQLGAMSTHMSMGIPSTCPDCVPGFWLLHRGFGDALSLPNALWYVVGTRNECSGLGKESSYASISRASANVTEYLQVNEGALLEFETVAFLHAIPLYPGAWEPSPTYVSAEMNVFNESWCWCGEKSGEARSALSYDDAWTVELPAGCGAVIWPGFILFRNYQLRWVITLI